MRCPVAAIPFLAFFLAGCQDALSPPASRAPGGPDLLVVPADGFTQVVSGRDHACALRADGTVACWGGNPMVLPPPADLGGVTQLAAGVVHTCGVKTDGTVACWGYMNGVVPAVYSPPVGVLQLSTGNRSGCAILVDGRAHCWHSVGFFPAGMLTQVGVGWTDDLCGIRSDGAVQCWPGDGVVWWVPFLPGNPAPTRISVGSFNVCIVRDGNVACEGDNSFGQTSVPADLGLVSDVSIASLHACAVKTDATLACWGDNRYGQTDVPADLGPVLDVSVGARHTCALGADGVVVCWGNNDFGQLEVPTTRVLPTADFGVPPSVLEGTPFVLSLTNGHVSGYTGDAGLAYAFDCADGAGYGAFGPSGTATCNALDDAVRTVRGTVRDRDGDASEYTSLLTIGNVAPTLGAISAPVDPVPVGVNVSVSAPYTDPGTLDTHWASLDWDANGAGAAGIGTASGGVAGGSHTYEAPGVYAVEFTVTDDDGGSASRLHEFIVVYDPTTGFVTGGGWIESPEGACRYDACTAATTGRATFGFVSRYRKGATTPEGNTEFQFRAGGLSFRSTLYDWLVIAGARAMYKGSGTIDGAGDFGFLLSAIDGELPGGGGLDRFRIKIWDRLNGDQVVYDNQLGSDDDAAPTTAIEGGSIQIHSR